MVRSRAVLLRPFLAPGSDRNVPSQLSKSVEPTAVPSFFLFRAVYRNCCDTFRQDVHAKSTSRRHLRVPLQGGCAGRAEGFLRPETPGAGEHPEPARHQDDAVAQVEELREGAVRLAPLLLVSDQRGYRVPARLPASAVRDRAVDAEARRPLGATACPHPGRPPARGSEDGRGPPGIPAHAAGRPGRQEGRRRCRCRRARIPWWIRPW